MDPLSQLSSTLIKHENFQRVKYNKNNNCFTLKITKDKEIKMSGLTVKMKKQMWNDYIYQKTPTRNKDKSSRMHDGIRNGIARGTMVHEQLRDYFNLETRQFLDKYNNYNPQHPFVTQAIYALNEWKLTPFLSELVVADEKNKMATSVDALCIDKNGKLIKITCFAVLGT